MMDDAEVLGRFEEAIADAYHDHGDGRREAHIAPAAFERLMRAIEGRRRHVPDAPTNPAAWGTFTYQSIRGPVLCMRDEALHARRSVLFMLDNRAVLVITLDPDGTEDPFAERMRARRAGAR